MINVQIKLMINKKQETVLMRGCGILLMFGIGLFVK